MLVPIEKIKAIPEAQPRVAMDTSIVESYADAIRGGAEFPPVTAFFDGRDYWLADGFHRLAAWRAIGAIEVPLDKRTGGRRDAILYSCGANAAHGLRRTNEDKRRAVRTLLKDEEWSQRGDRWIADAAAVDHKTVASLREKPHNTALSTGELPQLTDNHAKPLSSDLPTRRTGRDGKQRALPRRKGESSSARRSASEPVNKGAPPIDYPNKTLRESGESARATVRSIMGGKDRDFAERWWAAVLVDAGRGS